MRAVHKTGITGVADTLGWIYYQKGAYQSSVGILQEALKIERETNSPDNPRIHYHLGMAYAAAGQSAKAADEYKLALTKSPSTELAATITAELKKIQTQ